jgi:hypothetical protein
MNAEWHNGEVVTKRVEVKTFHEVWICPQDGCDGEMQYNGYSWSCYPEGHHHTCTKCGFTSVPHEGMMFPRQVFVKVEPGQ